MCLPGYAAVLCDTVIVPGNQSYKLRLFTGSQLPVNPADNSTQDHRILLPPHVGPAAELFEQCKGVPRFWRAAASPVGSFSSVDPAKS